MSAACQGSPALEPSLPCDSFWLGHFFPAPATRSEGEFLPVSHQRGCGGALPAEIPWGGSGPVMFPAQTLLSRSKPPAALRQIHSPFAFFTIPASSRCFLGSPPKLAALFTGRLREDRTACGKNTIPKKKNKRKKKGEGGESTEKDA